MKPKNIETSSTTIYGSANFSGENTTLKNSRTYLNVGDLAEFRKMFVEFVDRIYFDGNLSDFQTKIVT